MPRRLVTPALCALLCTGLGACGGGDEDAEFAGLPTWCDPTRAWTDTQRAFEDELLEEINLARERPKECGQLTMPAASPVVGAPKLQCAARMHARDMADAGFEAHEGSNGQGTSSRLASATYAWFAYAELLDTQSADGEQVVQAWLADPPRCRELMGPTFVELGVGYADGAWAALLGNPQG